jgi:hypothetical protein
MIFQDLSRLNTTLTVFFEGLKIKGSYFRKISLGEMNFFLTFS